MQILSNTDTNTSTNTGTGTGTNTGTRGSGTSRGSVVDTREYQGVGTRGEGTVRCREDAGISSRDANLTWLQLHRLSHTFY